MRSPRFCIHIGLPKTATTTLQKQIFIHHPQIEYLGKYITPGFMGKQKFRDLQTDHLMKCILKKSMNEKGIGGLQRLLKDQILPHLDLNKLLLVSQEGISSGDLPSRARRARNFGAIFNRCKIVIVLREPLSLIESLYFQKMKELNLRKQSLWVKCPDYYSINKWLERYWNSSPSGPLWNLDYYRTIEAFGSVFGRTNVGIFLYEDLTEHPSLFFKQFCEFTGIDFEKSLQLISDQRDNVRWNKDVIDRLETIQTSFVDSVKFRLSSIKKRKEMLGIRKADSFDDTEKAEAEIADVWKKRIVEYTRPGNNALMREWGLKLKPYDYPV